MEGGYLAISGNLSEYRISQMQIHEKKPLPTDEQMLALKQELNFLLWTSNQSVVPKNFPFVVKSDRPIEQAKIDIQCVSHALVTAAIFMGLGYDVTTRAGMAFVLDAMETLPHSSSRLNAERMASLRKLKK